ncbi:DUF2905 domain-containing protein [Sphingomonas antarctica]|uniref:hypothetical protein n=1 Tax=Sphingomonas antarctica TaxID=2040274 RepID=UPI0039E7806D
MKIVLIIFSLLVIAMGVLWVGQGSGMVMWPASSFMLGEQRWTLWGALLALAGIIILLRAARR